MTNTKLEQLRKAIIKANPSISELKFGCIIETKNEYDIPNIGRTNKVISEYNSDFDELKIDCGWYKKDRFKIIGRDITLEDCLIAINKKQLKDEYGDRAFVMINDNGMIQTDLYNWEEKPVFWQMGNHLHQQEQETIDFLWDLICK